MSDSTPNSELKRRGVLEMLRMLLARHWKLILGAAVLLGGAFGAVTAGLPYQYKITTRVFSRNEEGGAQQVNIGGLQTNRQSARRQLIGGRHVLQETVRKTGGNLLLYPDLHQNPLGRIYYVFAGKLGAEVPVDGGIYFSNVKLLDTSLREAEVDAAVSEGEVSLEIEGLDPEITLAEGETYEGERIRMKLDRVIDGASGGYTGTLFTVEQAAGMLQKQTVYGEYGGNSEVFDLGLIHRNTHYAKRFTSTAFETYREVRIEGFNEELSSRLQFAKEEVDRVREELYNKLSELAQIAEDTDPELLSKEGESVLKRLTQLRIEEEKLRLKLNRFRTLLEDFRAEDVGEYLLFLDEGSQRSALQSLSSSYLSKKAEKERLLEDLTPQHPKIKALNNEMNSISDSIRSNVENLVDELERRLEENQELINEYESRADQLPELQRQRSQIEQSVEVQKEIYKFLVRKRMEAEAQLEGFRPSFHVIDEPMIPVNPHRPSIKVGILAGGVSGLFLAVFWLAWQILVAGRVVSPLQSELALGTRTLLVSADDVTPQAERCAGLIRKSGAAATVVRITGYDDLGDEFISALTSTASTQVTEIGGRGELTVENTRGRSVVALAGWGETGQEELSRLQDQVGDLGGELACIALLDPEGGGRA